MERLNALGPIVVSLVILGLFGANLLLGMPSSELLNTCVTLVVGYWVGSSSGSAAKTAAAIAGKLVP